MSDIKAIKEKFNELQENVTKMNNQKIGLESEIKTIKDDVDALVKKLLEKSGKKTIEEALGHFKEEQEKLETQKDTLSKELDKFLDTENSKTVSLD